MEPITQRFARRGSLAQTHPRGVDSCNGKRHGSWLRGGPMGQCMPCDWPCSQGRYFRHFTGLLSSGRRARMDTGQRNLETSATARRAATPCHNHTSITAGMGRGSNLRFGTSGSNTRLTGMGQGMGEAATPSTLHQRTRDCLRDAHRSTPPCGQDSMATTTGIATIARTPHSGTRASHTLTAASTSTAGWSTDIRDTTATSLRVPHLRTAVH